MTRMLIDKKELFCESSELKKYPYLIEPSLPIPGREIDGEWCLGGRVGGLCTYIICIYMMYVSYVYYTHTYV